MSTERKVVMLLGEMLLEWKSGDGSSGWIAEQ